MRKNLMYTGLCLSLFAFAAGVPSAQAQVIGTEDVTVDISIPTPDIVTTPLSFGGEYFAQQGAGTQATATVTTAGVLTNATGTAGGARLIPIDIVTVPPAALTAAVGGVTPGAPSATMSLQIRDDNTPANVFVIMDDGAGSTQLRVDTWTAAITGGIGTLTGFSGTTGNGTLTLNNAGLANFNLGGRMSTIAGGAGYAAGTYTGTIRITLSY